MLVVFGRVGPYKCQSNVYAVLALLHLICVLNNSLFVLGRRSTSPLFGLGNYTWLKQVVGPTEEVTTRILWSCGNLTTVTFLIKQQFVGPTDK